MSDNVIVKTISLVYLIEMKSPEVKKSLNLRLRLFQMYSGMLKMSRDIDHYTLEPAADQQGVYNVMFGDRPAVLKVSTSTAGCFCARKDLVVCCEHG